jgi:serine phosphatase RsbU (regulator of sigma subunit)
MLTRLSVRVLVPVLVVVPVAGVAAALGWIGVQSSRRSVDDLAGQIVAQIGSRVGQRVEDHLRVAGTASDATMVLVRSGVLDPDDLPAWRSTLWDQWRAFDGLSGIAFGRPDGAVTWIASYPGDAFPEYAIKAQGSDPRIDQFDVDERGGIADRPDRQVEYDLFSRPWYITGAEGAVGNFPGSRYDPAWSPIYSWSRADGTGDTLGVSYARPVYGAGNAFVGVLDTEIELVELSKFLATLKIGETGLAVIAERDGRLVAASRVQGLLDAAGERRPVWAAEDEPTRILGAAAKARVESGNGIGLERIEARDGAWYIEVTPVRVPVGEGLEWFLVIGVPEADLVGGVRATQERAMQAGLVAASAAVLIGMFGAFWIARPILRLRQHLRLVGAGDLDTQLHLNGASEFSELGREINAMQAGLKDRIRLQKSLELAMDVQQALLPKRSPTLPHLDVYGYSAYCDETGGDYYDYLEVDSITPSGLAVVLGDVMGHGIASALLMATARGVIRSRAGEVGSLAELLNYTNTALLSDSGGFRFMTMLLVMIDPGSNELRWASAGQGPPMVYDSSRGLWLDFESGGLPLGIEPDERYVEHHGTPVHPGMIVVLSTDGLWEAMNEQKKQFGEARVRAVVEENATASSEQICRALRDALDAHCGVLRPTDDVTMVIVKIS